MWRTIRLLVLGLAAGAVVQTFCARADRRRFRPAGRMVTGLHVREMGIDGPPVVFEAGLAATSVNWQRVQDALAARARTVSYDRAGLGWSAPVATVPSLVRMTDDLRRLVVTLDLPRPLMLVGHSFGTWIVRAYASRYPEDVSALLLVDPVSPNEIAPRRLRRAALLSDAAAVLARLGLIRLGLWGLLRRGGGNPGPVLGLSPTLRRMAQEVTKLPAGAVPMLRARWSEPRFFRQLSAAIRALPACARDARDLRLPNQLPVVVLAGAHRSRDYLQALDLPGATLIVVPGSGHWIHLDAPHLVARTILEACGGEDAGGSHSSASTALDNRRPITIPMFIDFVAPSTLLRERDRPSPLPIIGNGPPGTFVLFPDGLRISLPTDQIVYADDRTDHARVGFGGMQFVGIEEEQLVFVRVREVQPEERLSPARSHTMRLDPARVHAVTMDGSPLWP